MMRYVHFTIPGEPQGKGRPRFTKIGRAYTPGRTAAYESIVRACYWAQVERGYIPKEPWPKETPLCVTIDAVFAPAKSTPKKRLEKMLAHIIRPTKKPDWDNIGKIVCDSLNGLAYYDDSQITTAHVYKRYGPEPYVEVSISEDL